MSPEHSISEQRRLETLSSYEILDTPREAAFDNLVKLAAQSCETPVATVTLIDRERQWFKASIGLAVAETDRAIAICDYTVRAGEMLIVPDAGADPRFAENPFVVGQPFLRFYAGVPLVAPDGAILGTLAVMDVKPRQLSERQQNALQLLAGQAMQLFELHLLKRKEAQSFAARALRESEKRFSMLFSSAAVGIALCTPDGIFVQANPAFCTIVGYREEELHGKHFQSITHPDDREGNLERLTKLLSGEIENFVMEKRLIRKEGETAWARTSISCVHSDQGEPLHVITVAEDITERVTAQKVLSGLQERLAITFEHMTDAFCLLDRDWRVSFINQEGQRLVLHTAEQLQNVRLWDRFPPTMSSELYTQFHRAMNEQVPVHFELFYPPLKNWFEVHAHPVPDGLAVYFRGIAARKAAEEALRESEERFRHLAETIDDVFWIWDPAQFRVTYVSPRYQDIFGRSREELYRDPSTFVRDLHPEDLERLRQLYLEGAPYIKMDYRLLLGDGRIRWVSVRTFPVYDEAGSFRHTVGVAHDITQLMEATEQLRASEEQYRLLFANNPHPMYVYDGESLRFLAVNEKAIAHYGYSEEEFLSMTILDIRPSEEIPRLLAAQNHSGPFRDGMLWKHRKKNGALLDVETYVNAIQFNGRAARIVLSNDVTARRRAEQQIRQQAALLDKARDAIMVCDLHHHITYWNHGAERIYGWSAEEILSRPVTVLLFSDPELFQRAYQQLLVKGEWFGELAQIDRNGRELLVETRLTVVRDEVGEAQAVLAINTDITERKRLESHFLRAQRMESIGTLAGGIAHDLNNVLAPILLSLGILKRQSRTPSEQKLLDTLEKSAQRGADMVRQVLSFARGVEGERIVVNVGHVVHDLENLIRDTFDRSIRIQVRVEENLLPILGDPTQIHQVVLNLCVNARDAMPEGGNLEIGVATVRLDSEYTSISLRPESGSFVVLRVSDTGIGIPRAIRDRIFDPFFTTKEIGKGTGLGLPTVQAVIKSHGGFINVESEEGIGSVFTIYLPAIEQVVATESLSPTTLFPVHAGGLVLVIDDEEAIRLSTQQTLESYGYRVLTADGGVEAITIYATHRHEIAVVLTDMMMPGMDGLATIKSLRALNSKVDVIAASGLAASDTVAKATALGVSQFLQKPFTAEALLKVLAEIMSEKSLDNRAES